MWQVFAALGLEHTIANVFFLGAAARGSASASDETLSLGAMLGANLVWVLLGNVIGALGGITAPLWFAYGEAARGSSLNLE